MGIKFDQVYESVVDRYQTGGYLTGDVVYFRKNYKKSPTYLAMSSDMQNKVDEFATCGLNCRVVQVGDRLSGASAGNQFKLADDVVLTLGLDQGGGRYIAKITVPASMVDLTPPKTFNTPKPSDERDVESRVTIKPEPVEDFTDHITRKTDAGGPNGPKRTYRNTNLKLESKFKFQDVNNISMIYEQVVGKADRIDNKERTAITSALISAGLDGNGRFDSVSQAVGVAADALDSVGFSLDMVPGDLILGAKGGRLLSFRYKNDTEDPYFEHPEIENSRVSFNWEDLGRDVGFEVVAYAS